MPTFKKVKVSRATLRKRPAEDAEDDDVKEDVSTTEPRDATDAHAQIVSSLVKTRQSGLLESSKRQRLEQVDDGDDTCSNFTASGKAGSLISADATRTLDVDGHTGKPSKRHGPLRAPSNVRVTCRFDYQQDICKDYKETGFCGYGDSCIFLHDRGDYKTGWQLEREWSKRVAPLRDEKGNDYEIDPISFEVRKKVQRGGEPGEEEDVEDECPICDDPFKEPVLTECGHHFCEACALKHDRENNGRCFECNAKTQGNFKMARDLMRKLRVLRAKRAQEGETKPNEEVRSSTTESDQGDEDDVSGGVG